MVKRKRSSPVPVRRRASAAEVTKELRTKGYRVVAMSRSMVRDERHDLRVKLHRFGRIGDLADFRGSDHGS
jgi:hypothetical protein